MRFSWAVAMMLAVHGVGSHAPAQSPAPLPTPSPASDTKPYVLHVYANLVQVPVLALDSNFERFPPLTLGSFNIRLDSGPAFHPTKMHIEGEEPIALGMVLDASGDQEHLLRNFAESAETMAMASLRPHDHLTLFAVDCKIVRSSLNLSALPLTLGTAVRDALTFADLHNGSDQRRCGKSVRLWDTAALALKELAAQPGRRVLILVSAGEDRKSLTSWNMLRNFAADHSIAIFGLRDLDRFAGDAGTQLRLHEAGVYYDDKLKDEDRYRELCEATGGLIFTTPVNQLTTSLQRLIAMARGRYILEFPRADNSTPGRHFIDVALPGLSAYVATSGVTVEVPDAAVESDPTTVPSAPSPAIMGKRRGLSTQ